jgi:hypothetical protein
MIWLLSLIVVGVVVFSHQCLTWIETVFDNPLNIRYFVWSLVNSPAFLTRILLSHLILSSVGSLFAWLKQKLRLNSSHPLLLIPFSLSPKVVISIAKCYLLFQMDFYFSSTVDCCSFYLHFFSVINTKSRSDGERQDMNEGEILWWWREKSSRGVKWVKGTCNLLDEKSNTLQRERLTVMSFFEEKFNEKF